MISPKLSVRYKEISVNFSIRGQSNQGYSLEVVALKELTCMILHLLDFVLHFNTKDQAEVSHVAIKMISPNRWKELQMTKRLISLCLTALLFIVSSLTISPAPASANEIQNTSNIQQTVCIAIEKEASGKAKSAEDNNIFKNEDVEAIAAIAGASSAGAGLGSITVLTTTTTAHGILALLGAGTTTVVALPVAGIVAASGLIAYGGYKVVKYVQSQDEQNLPAKNTCLSQM